MLELQGPNLARFSESLVGCGGASAALPLLREWLQSPNSFIGAIRRELDCDADHMVSKMEFRRWSKDGVLVAVLISMARARSSSASSDSELDAHDSEHVASADPPKPIVASSTAVAHENPAIRPQVEPPPNCPYPQWTAYKPAASGKSTVQAVTSGANDAIVVLKGPAFSDQCEERYQQWKSDMRTIAPRQVVDCGDFSAEINFFAMEICGRNIGMKQTLLMPVNQSNPCEKIIFMSQERFFCIAFLLQVCKPKLAAPCPRQQAMKW
jgi:hypothetical protein